MRDKNLWVGGILGVTLLVTGCGSQPKDSAEAQSRRTRGGEGGGATPVDVAIANVGELRSRSEFTGTTVPFRVVSLRSQVEGQLLALNVDVGDIVKSGQIVGQQDDGLLVTELNQAEAELASLKSEVARTKTQVSNAQAEVEKLRLELVQSQNDAQRQQKLFKEGAIAQQAAEQARTESLTANQALQAALEKVNTEKQAVNAAQGRVVAQQAAVASAEKRRNYSKLISPITGVVTEKVTEPGNLLQPGGEVLKIADFSRVKVDVRVSELELANIRLGQTVQVKLDALGDRPIFGQVTRISPAADAIARLVPVEVVIPNINGKIGSGLLARVNFRTRVQQRVIIPQTALETGTPPKQEQKRTSEIFILRQNSEKPTVTVRPVTLGESADGKVEILSGLQPGEAYVVRSGKPLKEGDRVRLSILSETNQKRSKPANK